MFSWTEPLRRRSEGYQRLAVACRRCLFLAALAAVALPIAAFETVRSTCGLLLEGFLLICAASMFLIARRAGVESARIRCEMNELEDRSVALLERSG
jgi:hypothetical protein